MFAVMTFTAMMNLRLLPILLLAFLKLSLLHAAQEKTNDTLRVGYTQAPPFIIQEGELLEGINIWLWQQVADDLGLEYQLVEMNFSDMLDSLKTGAIDVSINPLTITGGRSKHMEFTHSFFASHSTIAVAEPSSFQKIKQFFASFLHLNFLRGFLLLFFVLLFFGVLAWWFERKSNPDFRANHKGIWDGLWWSMVTLTTVGYGDKAPKTRMGKIAALALMFSGLLFVSGLTASIASSLTVNQLANSNDNLDAFKERKVGTVKSTEASDFLRTHFFKDVVEYSSLEVGLQSLQSSKVDAFVYDEPILYHRIKKDPNLANLQILPLKFDVQFYAFGIRQHAVELEQAISQRILELTESQEWEIVLNEFGLSEL